MNDVEQLKQPKALNKKHYIAYIKERNGDYDYRQYFKFTTASNPDDYLGEIAKSWYAIAEESGDDDREEFQDGYLFNGGEVYIEAGDYHEVDKELYDRIPYLTEM